MKTQVIAALPTSKDTGVAEQRRAEEQLGLPAAETRRSG